MEIVKQHSYKMRIVTYKVSAVTIGADNLYPFSESNGRGKAFNSTFALASVPDNPSPRGLKLGPSEHDALSSVMAVRQRKAKSTQCNSSGVSSASYLHTAQAVGRCCLRWSSL